MPWRLLKMEDYLPLADEQRMDMEWIRLDIVDNDGPTHRRLVEQRWQQGRLLSDWENLLVETGPSQLILDLAGTSPESRQIMKLSFAPHAVKLVQHMILSDDDAGQPTSDFGLPDFPGPFEEGDGHPDL